MTVTERPVELTGIEYRVLAKVSVSEGQVLTNVQLLQRVWHLEVRNIVKRLRRMLGDDASNPIYKFNEPHVSSGYPRKRILLRSYHDRQGLRCRPHVYEAAVWSGSKCLSELRRR